MLDISFRHNGTIALTYDDDDEIVIPKCMIEEFNKKFPSLNEDFLFILGKSLLIRKEGFRSSSNNTHKLPFGNLEVFSQDFISALEQICLHYPMESILAFFEEAKVQDLYHFIYSPEECFLEFI